MIRIATNAILFQLGWLICVFGGDRYALAWLLPYLLVHFRWIAVSPREWSFTLLSAGIGISLDWFALSAGLFTVAGAGPFPLWLACLWLLFATLIPHGLSWLQGRPLLAAIFGALGGSMSYLAGLKTGAASSEHVAVAVIFWAVQWAILLHALLALCRRWLAKDEPCPSLPGMGTTGG